VGARDPGRRAGGDDVTRDQCHDARQVGHQIGDGEDHRRGVRVLHDGAVDARLDRQVLHVRDLVEQHERGPGGAERVDGLAAGPQLIGHLQIAGADVVERHHAGHVLQGAGDGDVVAGFADDDGELGFIVDLGGDRRRTDGRAMADEGIGELAEEHRLGRNRLTCLSRMVVVVQTDADELLGLEYWRK
jgi:hypothetical protein